MKENDAMIETMEDVADNLKEIINLFVEFRSLRDVSQDLGNLETEIAEALERALKATKFDSDKVSTYMEAFQQKLEGLKVDIENLVDNINIVTDDLMWEIEI
jgi:cell fate (sporulation/competence/biofilm development) regulator YlbF (YheA/YmcA/DUF963 family)